MFRNVLQIVNSEVYTNTDVKNLLFFLNFVKKK
jgi:hypothetical protein